MLSERDQFSPRSSALEIFHLFTGEVFNVDARFNCVSGAETVFRRSCTVRGHGVGHLLRSLLCGYLHGCRNDLILMDHFKRRLDVHSGAQKL